MADGRQAEWVPQILQAQVPSQCGDQLEFVGRTDEEVHMLLAERWCYFVLPKLSLLEDDVAKTELST